MRNEMQGETIKIPEKIVAVVLVAVDGDRRVYQME